MKRRIRVEVRTRVLAALAALVLLCVAVQVGLGVTRSAEERIKQATSMVSYAQSVKAAHYSWANQLADSLYAGQAFEGQTDPTACMLGQWIYGDVDTTDETLLTLRNQMRGVHEQVHESAQQALGMSSAQARPFYHNTVQPSVAQLVALLDEAITHSEGMSETCTRALETSILVIRIVSAVCGVLALLCLLSLVHYVLKQVIQPILQITAHSQVMLEGQLDLDLGYASENELGQLAYTLEQSMRTIRSYVAEVDRILGELAQGNFNVHPELSFQGDFHEMEQAIETFTGQISLAMANITAATAHVSTGAGQISASSQHLAEGAMNQASAVEQLFAALDALSKDAESNVQRMQAARQTAGNMGEQAGASNLQMQDMVSAMDEIKRASDEIGRIIDTIENIAFQTNILALNAAVEAARAGSAGKGFAVVADEVRNLASKSEQAARATKELIENTIAAVQQGSHIVDAVSVGLNQTQTLADQSNREIADITQTMEKQAVSIAQITDGVSQISAIVQTNSATSEQSAAVSGDLFQQAKLLQDQTARFRTKPQ